MPVRTDKLCGYNEIFSIRVENNKPNYVMLCLVGKYLDLC